MRRVVISGMGAISCLGRERQQIVDALRRGRSGIGLIPERKEMGFRSALGGRIKDLDPPETSRRSLRTMGPGSYIAVSAARQALEDAGLEAEDVKNDRTAVVIGNLGNFQDTYRQCHKFLDEKLKLGGSALQKVMGDSVSANLTVFLGNRGSRRGAFSSTDDKFLPPGEWVLATLIYTDQNGKRQRHAAKLTEKC